MGVVIRQSIKGTIVTYLGAFIGFLTVMFIRTKFLSEEDIGLISVILEAGTLFGMFAAMGTSSSIIRFFPYFKNKGYKNNGFFFYTMAMPAIGCAIIIPLYLFLKEPITDYFATNSALFNDYFYWVVPMIVMMTFWGVFDSYAAANMRIVVPKVNREIILKLLLIVVYALFGYSLLNLNQLVFGFVWVHGIAFLLTLLYMFRVGNITFKHNNSLISKPLRKDIGRYTFFMILGAFSGSILNKLDFFMVSGDMGLDYAGIFIIALQMAVIIDIPQRSITGICSPLAADALKCGDTKAANDLYKKVSLHQMVAGGTIFVLIWMNIDDFFRVIPNGEVYASGKWVVFFIGIARLIEVTLGFGTVLISFSKYYKWTLYFTFVLIALGIATNKLLIPVLGISGAAIATVITSVAGYSLQQWIVLRKIKGNPYSIGGLKAIVILLLLLGIGHILPSLGNPWIDIIFRSGISVVLGALLFYKLKVSPEINRVMDKILGHLLRRK